jgi:hypothetical protein
VIALAPLALALSPWVYYGEINAGDLASTAYAERCGFHEGNPIVGHDWPRRLAVKAGETALEAWTERHLGKKGRTIERVAIGALRAVVIVHNLRAHH